MYRVNSLGLAILALLAAGHLNAGKEAKWLDLTSAQKAAPQSNSPVFVVVIMAVQGYPDGAFDSLRTRSGSDADAPTFLLASVNIGRLDMGDAMRGGSGFTANPEMVEKYGAQGTCAVYAPNAKRPLWVLEYGSSKPEVFKLAREAWEAWRKEIDALDKEQKQNKDLKKDADFLVKFGEAWAKGKDAARALDCIDDAIKLIKKADKTDSRVESLSLRGAQVAHECGESAIAIARFDAFLKTFKESADRAAAEVGRAEAMIDNGDPKGALSSLQAIKNAPSGLGGRIEAARERARKLTEKK